MEKGWVKNAWVNGKRMGKWKKGCVNGKMDGQMKKQQILRNIQQKL